MNRAERQSQKRIEVVEAIILKNEFIVVVDRIYNLSQRILFDWLVCYPSFMAAVQLMRITASLCITTTGTILIAPLLIVMPKLNSSMKKTKLISHY